MTDTSVRFRLLYIAAGIDLHGETLRLRDRQSRVSLRLAERASTERGYATGDTLCEASCTRSVPLISATRGLSADDKIVDAVFDVMYRQITRLLWLVRWRRGSVGPHRSIRLVGGFA